MTVKAKVLEECDLCDKEGETQYCSMGRLCKDCYKENYKKSMEAENVLEERFFKEIEKREGCKLHSIKKRFTEDELLLIKLVRAECEKENRERWSELFDSGKEFERNRIKKGVEGLSKISRFGCARGKLIYTVDVLKIVDSDNGKIRKKE